ncbi:MAG: hypothetical protein AAGI17_03740 [Planctomycetota bacterium]
MIWWRSRYRDLREAGERFRAEHSRFLTIALRRPNAYPRIPAKPVREGGFSVLTSRESGRRHTRRWWSLALDRVGLLERD